MGFISNLNFSNPDYTSNFSSGIEYPTVGYDFTDDADNWKKSPSNAIETTINYNGSNRWLNFRQYGYQGGSLHRNYPEILNRVSIRVLLPDNTGDSFEIKLNPSASQPALKIAINRNSIKVFEFTQINDYVSLAQIDSSWYDAGREVILEYNRVTGRIVVIMQEQHSFFQDVIFSNATQNSSIQYVEFYVNAANYPITLQISEVEAQGAEQRNLELIIPDQLKSSSIPAQTFNTLFTSDYPDNYEFTELSTDWVKSGTGFTAIIKGDLPKRLALALDTSMGSQGFLSKSYPQILDEIEISMMKPNHTSNSATGVYLGYTIRILLNNSSISLDERESVYEPWYRVDTLITPIFAGIPQVYISYNKLNNTITARSRATNTTFVEATWGLGFLHIITSTTFFVEAFSGGIFTMNVFSVRADILAKEIEGYRDGDVLMVSLHEGENGSILPRTPSEFETLGSAVPTTLSLNSNVSQRFFARTLTVNETGVYKFTRGDGSSYYDSPRAVGFIVRGALLENLRVSYTEPLTVSPNGVGELIESLPCGAVLGDLIYGFIHNESNYDQMFAATPIEDTLWFEPFPYGTTSLREAYAEGEDGKARFEYLVGSFDTRIFSARISSSTAEPIEIPRLREYETQLPQEVPPRLHDHYSQRLLEVMGMVKDDTIADSLDAIAETFASTASEKRLLEIGADRLIDRYPTENLESYRQAVVNASSILVWRGTAKGIEDEITRFGYTATYIPIRYTDPLHWSEFILILRNGRIQLNLGNGGIWDIGMSLLERNALLQLVRRWKNSDERLAMIGYAFENNDFWGESGTWGDNTTWNSGGTKVIYARPYAWGDNPNDTWNSSQGTWGDTDTYPVQEG
jgi:hypothetical protein